MKISLIILCLSIMPCLIIGLNPQRYPYSPELAQSVLTPEGDNLPGAAGGISLLPAGFVDRDRNWRLLEILHQSDLDENNVFQIDGKEVIYYNAIHTDQVDSLVYYNYDATALTYLPYRTRKYYYDAAGEDIIRIDWHYAENPSNQFTKYTFEYDDQHRLIQHSRYNWNPDNSTHQIYVRFHWIIENDVIAERDIVYFENSDVPTDYTKTVFIRDTQGRNIGFLQTSSTDSLNWVNSYDCVTTYHPNDTSTGADQIHYFSNDFVTDFYNSMGSYYSFSMVAGYVVRDWTGSDWVNNNKSESTYNIDNKLSTITEFIYSDAWLETNRFVCDYNTDNNLAQFSYQGWNAANNAWNGYLWISSLTWEQYTAADDEVAPAVALSLSAYPNPFQNEVSFRLNSKDNAPSEAGIYNLKGQLVRQFGMQKGKTFAWDGKDAADKTVSNGIYLVKINQNGSTACSKIIRVK
jgi:hypothetical protein